MIHFYTITVIHNGDTVQVYPRQTGCREAGVNYVEVCQRIGTMVMSAGITSITVNRDEQLYRSVEVTAHNDEIER